MNVYVDMKSAAHCKPSSLPDNYVIPPHVVECIPESLARENTVMPLDEKRDRLVVAFSDPLEFEKYDKLRFVLNRKISVVHAKQQWIGDQISKCFG